MFICQLFDSFLFRKTYGTCRGSDKAGGGFIDDSGGGCPKAGADAVARNIVTLPKNNSFFVLQCVYLVHKFLQFSECLVECFTSDE